MTINTGFSEIKAEGANIIARFDDADLVAVQHSNGCVGIYAEDGDMLMQMSPLKKSDILDPVQIANRLMRYSA